MAFFGLPGLIPAISDWMKPELDDVVFCPVNDSERCGDVLLQQTPSDEVMTANRLTLGANLDLAAGTVIIANEIDLGGRTLRAHDRLIVIAREARNGTMQVTSLPPKRDRNERDGADGISGGTMMAVFGAVASTLQFNLSGSDGLDGLVGEPSSDGRDGRCDGFGRYRGAHAGGDGSGGGNGGHGGDGGSIDLWFGVGPVTNGQISVSAGRMGRGGDGGRPGRGGAGCTGLGGSQENENDGHPGGAGSNGRSGNAGVSNVMGANLPALIRFSRGIAKSPPTDFEEARREISVQLSDGE